MRMKCSKTVGKILSALLVVLVLFGTAAAADAPAQKINVYLAGDSTVKSYGSSRGEGGWGEFLQDYFTNDVAIVNHSEGGRSSRSFINEGRLDRILNAIKPNDYLFIQFGHNDCAVDKKDERYVPIGTPDAAGVYPVTAGTKVATPDVLKSRLSVPTCYTYDCGGTYKWYLKQFVDGAKSKGAIPVLVTPVSRIYFSGEKIRPHHDDLTSKNDAYVTAVKQLAAEEKVLCIDMFEITKATYERFGINETAKLQFVKAGGVIDNTHNNKFGGFYVGGLMAQEIKKANISISQYVKKPSNPVVLDTTELILVGDSTVCQYGAVDANYRVGRNGYGMQIGNYFTEKVSVRNLALSGRATKDFITYPEYQTMLQKLDVGDYLMIGFGHNDEKAGERYSDPKGDINTVGSTKYNLYNYYIKPALDRGATPILVTPIVRRNSGLDGGHGQWVTAIKELGAELGITVIDATKITGEYYQAAGQEQTAAMHAEYTDVYMKSKNYITADGGLLEAKRVDNTHLNAYGAKVVAYKIVNALKESESGLKKYTKEVIEFPNK